MMIFLLLLTSLAFMQNYSLQFEDGEYVEFPYSGDLDLVESENFSIITKLKLDDDGHTIFWSTGIDGDPENSLSIGASMNSGGEFRVFWEHGSGTNYEFLDTFDYDNQKFIDLAVTWDGSVVKTYINGLFSSQALPPQGPGQTADRNYKAGGNGEILELSIWSKYLSDNEIQMLYNDSISGFENGLVAYWPILEGSGNFIYDITGNGHDGTLYGATWVENIEGCADEFACNYNPEANLNDGSCTYDCYENGEYSIEVYNSDTWVQFENLNREQFLDFTIEGFYRYYGSANDEGHSAIFSGESSDFFIGKDAFSDRLIVQDAESSIHTFQNTNAFDGNWHHIAYSFKDEPGIGGNGKLFLDGVLIGSHHYDGGTGEIWLGRENEGSDFYHFKGYFDNVIITNEQKYTDSFNLFLDNESDFPPTAYYNFNQGQDIANQKLIDISGNQNHGIIHGQSMFRVNQPPFGCTDSFACNYEPDATYDDGSCFTAEDYGWCDCDGNLPDQCGLCYGNNDCLTKINILALEDSGYIKNKLNEYGNSDFNILEFSDVCESCSALSELNFENAINQYDLDVIIFPNGVLASNWNTQDIFPPLTNFMNAGGQVILMQYNIMQWISNESSWFEPYLITEYNINNGTIAADDCHCLDNDIVFENIDINSHPIVSNIHDYGPNCSITTGDPYAYDLPQPFSNNFFGLVGWCGDTVGGADYGVGQEQIVGGRNIGNGEIILFGAGLPSWGTINLMGNIITHFQSELESILYLESQQIISGETTSIPIFLDKESAVDGLIFSIDVNSGFNEEIISMDMQFENGINGLFNYVNGMGSVVISDLNSYNQGETILLGHIFIELPNGIPQGEQYYISIRNASGVDQNYELIDIIGYQNISFDVITAPPEYTGLSESYCLVEGESLESSFQILDDLNMDINLEYDCPSYVDITFNEESHDGLISINSNFGDEGGECTFTATTNDVIPEVTSLVIPININHYPTLGIGDGFNVVENELFTFEIIPSDLDGDNLTVEYLGGSDYVNLDGTTLSINPPFGSDNSEICFSLSDDGCPPIANQEFCYNVLINHQPLVNCDTDIIHIPETDIVAVSCIIDDGGDSDIDQGPSLNQDCSYVNSVIDGQNIILEISPNSGDTSCILDLTIEDNTGLSNTTQLDIQVYKTYLVGDVRPQSDSELAGEFGDGIIVAPDVVNILKVATGVSESPTLDSDLFDAFDSNPQDIDIDNDGDVFDQAERGGDQSIDVSDVILSLLTATNVYEEIFRVENDYLNSTPINNSRDNDDNRTNDLITMESEVVRDLDGVHISIPIRLERGSVDNLTSTAIGFELVSDDECLDFVEMEFISDYSSGIMNVQTDNKLSTLMYDMNPIESNTVIERLGELKFTLPLASSESSFTINGLVASGSNDEYDVINIDFNGNSVIEFNPIEIIQTKELSNGANLGSFYSIPDDNSIGNMMLSLDDYVTGLIGEGVAASPNPVLGWVGSLAEVSETSGYWIKVDNNILYESPIQSIQTYEDWIADIHIGANLMAYPCLLSSDIVSDDILSMPNQFEEFFHTGIIGEGVAAYYNPVLGWIGSLADEGLVPGNGYWMKSTEDFIGFNWECPELTCDQSNLRQVLVDYEIPEELEYVQSSQQAFYFISEIDLNQVSINEGDWVVAMYGNNVVGARAWNGLFTDIPVMGFDSSDYSATYVENGKTPIFKLYKDGQMIDLFGDIPEFSNLEIHMISLTDVDPSIPSEFILESAYPNPFNPSTTISYGVSEATHMNVSVYNIQGQQVGILYDGFTEPGYYQKTWNASELSSGIYIVRMSTDTGFISNQKVVLVK